MKPETLASLRRLRPTLADSARLYAVAHGASFGNGKGLVALGQPRNLLNAAATTAALVELTGLLRYQIGRGGRGWVDANSGLALAALIETSAADVRTTCGIAAADQSPERHALDVRVARELLGFVVRELTFATSEPGRRVMQGGGR